MEICGVYIFDEILDNIIHKLNYKDMITITYVNQYLSKKYKDFVKYRIFKIINNDYQLFHDYLYRYKYNTRDMKNLLIKGINEIKTIWGSSTCGYYDLRFLFEIINKGVDIDIMEDSEINQCIKYDNLRLMIKAIERSKSFCRYETIHKINSEPILRSLHRTFNPISNENNNSEKIKVMNKKLHRFHGDVWIYIDEYVKSM